MRKFSLFLAVALAACGSSDSDPAGAPDSGLDSGLDAGPDAAERDAAAPDASDSETDAQADASDAERDAQADAETDPPPDAATCPTLLLAGGSDVVAQGWSVVMRPPAVLSYVDDYTRIVTSTEPGSREGGQLLLSYAGALEPDLPFKLEVVMQVESVTAHNAADAAAAIMGRFTPQFGTVTDRNAMVYLDSARIGFADDSQAADVSVVDGAYHTYVLAVDAQGLLRVSRDGVEVLTRTGYGTNGTIAVGDQTNDANVDATMRIRSVRKLCL